MTLTPTVTTPLTDNKGGGEHGHREGHDPDANILPLTILLTETPNTGAHTANADTPRCCGCIHPPL